MIYGFGFLKDVQIELNSSFQVIYGKNEAGKSTILSFIETMLFGFPKRQQEFLYSPKSGGIHGGKLIANIQNAGRLTIERVRYREPDEAIIFLNDERLDEASLHALLQRVDRLLFQQLFSARLEHLRKMESLHEDELNRYLLGASVSGHLSLHQTEADLDAKRTELFRPQGRKPVMNMMIPELNELVENIRKSEHLKEEYERKANEKAEIENKLLQLQTEQKQAINELDFYKIFQDVVPLYENIEWHQRKLEQLPKYSHFPENGIERLQQLQNKIVDLEAEQRALQQRITKLQQSLPKVKEAWLEQSDSIDLLRERSEVYQTKLEQLFLVTEQIKHAEQSIQRFLENAGSDWTLQTIADADVSLATQEKLKTLVSEVEKLTNECDNVERDLDSLRSRLKTAEMKADELNKTLLSNEEREQIQSLLSKHNHYRIEQETALIQKMLDRSDTELRELQNYRIFFLSIAAFIGIAAFVFVFFTYGQVWITGTLLLFVISLSIYVFNMERKQRLKREKLFQLRKEEAKRLEQLLRKQQEMTPEHIEEAKKRWFIDEERRKEWFVAKHNVEQLQREYERFSNEYAQLKRKQQSKIQEAKEWAYLHRYPKSLSVSRWLDWFQQLKEAKQVVFTLERAKTEKKTLKQWIDEYEQEVHQLCLIFQLPANDNATSLLLKLSKLLAEEKAKKLQAERIQQQVEEEQKRADEVTEKREQYAKEINELLQSANCKTEEQFFKLAKVHEESQKLKDEINKLTFQIDFYCRDEKMKRAIQMNDNNSKFRVEEKMSELKKRLDEIEREQSMFMQRRAQLQVEMQSIEEGGEYEETLQKLEFKKAQFRQFALEWATYSVALHLLAKTKERFRHDRLPKVIALATEYFSKMTNDAYRSIFVPVDGETFFVERHDGVQFSPKELSRGTQEQLYLALRLALIISYPSSFRFPILLDDILVHFDQQRRQAALQLLYEISRTHQLLFFTCHEQIAKECKGEIMEIDKQTINVVM